METKRCFKCGETKELTAFYKHKMMADGHLNKCKDCTKKDTKARTDVLLQDPVWVEKEKERQRKKYYRLGYKELHKPSYEMKKKSISRYNNKYPEKVLAKNASQHLKREKGIELHHWSYNEEHFKDVIEVSVKDHNTIHRYTKYDQERKMYRDLNGVLLDTKQAAITYYKTIGVSLPF